MAVWSFSALVVLCVVAALAQAQLDGNRDKKCAMGDGRTGYCVPDDLCFANGTIIEGGDILDTDTRIDDKAEIPLEKCGGFLLCCVLESETKTPAPGPEVTPAPGPEVTPAPGPEVTPAPGPEVTPAPGPEVTPAPGPEVTPAPGPEVTPAPGPDVTPSPGPGLNTSNCALYYGDCHWCVGLYRRGGDVTRLQRLESGLYCVGALLTPRVVLTAATCVRTVGDEAVWARAPLSEDPAFHYHVSKKIYHPQYNTGSRENDIGLFVLKEEVRWSQGPTVACLGSGRWPPQKCSVVGFDHNEDIVMMEVNVTDADCPGRPRPRLQPDIACGTSVDDECYGKQGGAVLCVSLADGQGGMEVRGVARTSCRHRSSDVLLTKLEPHETWLQDQLRRFGAVLPRPLI